MTRKRFCYLRTFPLNFDKHLPSITWIHISEVFYVDEEALVGKLAYI